jgi:CRISPR-associated protein Cmr6
MIKQPFCPLYKEAVKEEPWNQMEKANRGLLFDKFGSAWRESNGKYEFDKGVKGDKEDAGEWLTKMARRLNESTQLEDALFRRRQLVAAMGGEILCVKNESRFVTGVGREHPIENGFAWHHSLGVPYLPGSSLKGILRSWHRENMGELKEKRWEEVDQTKEMFGDQEAVGEFIFLDMLPVRPPKLAVDVMTPHYGPYYEKGEIPGDWHSPVPIKFLTVEKGQEWHLAILPRAGGNDRDRQKLKELCEQLYEALDYSGAGAKTAVGYGRMVSNRELPADWEAKDQKKREEQKANQREQELLRGMTPLDKKLYDLEKNSTSQEAYVTWLQELNNGSLRDSTPEDRISIALKIKAEMQEKGKWKTSTSKKNPLKDKNYQKTLDVMKILEGYEE